MSENWAPELEMLDQLAGGPLSLPIIVELFKDKDRAASAIGKMLQGGELKLLDPDGLDVPLWKWREIASAPTFPESQYQLDITGQGLKRA